MIYPSKNINDFFVEGTRFVPRGIPFYGKSRKARPDKKRRKKRNRPGFISRYHAEGYAPPYHK